MFLLPTRDRALPRKLVQCIIILKFQRLFTDYTTAASAMTTFPVATQQGRPYRKTHVVANSKTSFKG
jgi:hypothetical protein